MEPLNLMWLEEPVPAENVDAYKLIADATSTPICAGENVYMAHGFRRMLEMGAVDIVMPDLQKAGGLGEGQRIANLANLYYVPFAPHMVASFLGAMASCHVCASVPNFMILEWQTYFDTHPMCKEIVTYDGPWVEKGFITVSEKPGIGVEINEEGMRRYAARTCRSLRELTQVSPRRRALELVREVEGDEPHDVVVHLPDLPEVRARRVHIRVW